MKKEKSKLIDWMICDDIRKEDNGKLIFVGVYFNQIIVPSIPFTMPQLVFFEKWNIGDTIPKKFEFKIIQPNKKIIGPITGELAPPETQEKRKTLHIQIGVTPFNIEVSGDYKIETKIDDVVFEIGSFNVTLKTLQ